MPKSEITEGKFTQEHAMKDQRGTTGTAQLSFLTSALDEGGWSTHSPAALPRQKDRVSTVKGDGCALLLVWMGAENLAPLGFSLWAIQDIVSRLTDYTVPAPITHNTFGKYVLYIFQLLMKWNYRFYSEWEIHLMV